MGGQKGKARIRRSIFREGMSVSVSLAFSGKDDQPHGCRRLRGAFCFSPDMVVPSRHPALSTALSVLVAVILTSSASGAHAVNPASFSAAANFPVRAGPQDGAVADLDGNSLADLVIGASARADLHGFG